MKLQLDLVVMGSYIRGNQRAVLMVQRGEGAAVPRIGLYSTDNQLADVAVGSCVSVFSPTNK